MSNVVTPLLKAATWQEQANEHGLLLSLLSMPVSPAQAPLLAYVIDQGEAVAYVAASEVDVAQRADFHQSALAALRQRLSQLDWVPVTEHEHTLMLVGDFNAAEGLLLPERLQEAQALLGATALLACTPKRGVLLVGAYESDDKAGVEAFVELSQRIYYTEANESISPVIWGVRAGQVKDALQLGGLYPAYVQQRYGRAEHQPSVVSTASANAAPKTLFSPGQIAFMTLFGTLLAGLYAMAHNYRSFGMQTASRAIWVAALVLVPLNVIWFMEAPRGPYDKLYPVVPALFAGIGSWLFQGGHVKQALASGERLNNVWRQCLVIVLALLAMVPVVAVLITFAPDW